MKQESSKKSKIIRIILIFLLILLIITYIGYSYYVKNNGKEAIKSEFFSKIGNHDLAFFGDWGVYSSIAEKLESENYEANSSLKMSTTMQNNMFSSLDLSKFELGYEVIRNNKENQYDSKIDVRYADNPVLTLDCILNDKQFAIKSDEIVNKYVGMNKNNAQNIINQLWERQVDLSAEKKLKNFLVDREPIDFEEIVNSFQLASYLNLWKESIPAGNFSKKENIIITLDSQKVSTTEYTVELEPTQTNDMFQKLAQKLSQDDDLMAKLVVKHVQDFEKEDRQILEYSDNDNISQIQGEENNFNTSINIWGENTGSENTTANEMNTQNNTASNQNTENTRPLANTIHLNTTSEETNTVEENNAEEPDAQNPQNEEEQPAEPTTTPNETENSQETPNTTQNNIQEEENVRTQGFIEVNEETEDTEEENFIVGENYQETVKNIQKSVQKINWSSYLLTGAKANCSKEELLEILQNILQEKGQENNRFIVKMYVSEDKVVKLKFELSESQESLDLEMISKSENEKYLLITILKGKDEATKGYDISLYQKKEDAVTKAKININKIHKNKIRQKTNINLETKGTMNSKKYRTTADVVYSDNDGEWKVNLENSLNFDINPEIEQLNEENCLFLDTLPEEELLFNRDAIKQKMLEVLRQKNRDLKMIDLYPSNSIVQQTDQQNTATEDENVRKQIKEILIQTISTKMTEYLQNGRNLTIQDLEGLTIPDYEVEISISPNLAIITVNGYRFNLDSEFHLSDS